MIKKLLVCVLSLCMLSFALGCNGCNGCEKGEDQPNTGIETPDNTDEPNTGEDEPNTGIETPDNTDEPNTGEDQPEDGELPSTGNPNELPLMPV